MTDEHVTLIPDKPQKPGDRNGYEFDLYRDEGGEGFFVGRIVSKILGFFKIVDEDGFCSTAREWHILLKAIDAGLAATTLGNVPDCPPLWIDEEQYWNLPSKLTNCVKCQWPSVVFFGTSVLSLIGAGILKFQT